MADSNKLWFTVGVRDEVTRELQRMIGTANELQKALELSKGGNASELKTSYDNVRKIEHSLYEVDKTLSRIRNAKISATDPDDISRLNALQLKIGKIRAALERFKEQVKADPNSLTKQGVVESLLSHLNFNEATYQANNFASSVERNVNKAISEQTNLANGLASAYDKVTEATKRTSKIQDQVVNQFNSYLSLYGVEKFLKSVITIGGQFEIQHVALQNILGDLQDANILFGQLQGLAVESPMTFRQIAGYTKQLAAFSIPTDELYDTTRRLADLSTGLGIDMGRLILAYGQVRSAAVLRGQELRQFTEAGIPLVQRLAEEFTKLNGKVVKTGDVFGLISKRQVPFEMVQKILWDMTNEGGQFYNMQALIADTLAGKWQKLTDVWEIALGKLADGSTASGKSLKWMLDTTISLVSNLEKVMPLVTGALMAGAGRSIIAGVGRFYSGDTKGIMENIKAAQNMNALEIEREHILGKIDATRKSELLAQNANLRNSISILASTGRLNTMQLIALRLKKQITEQDLQQMMAEKAITQEQYKQITTTGRLGMLKMQMKDVLGSFFSVPNLAAMGIGVAVSYAAQFIMDLKQAEEEAQRLREQIEDNANGIVNSSAEVLKSTGEAVSQSQMYDAIGVMSEYLKQNSASWQDVESIMLSMTGPDVLTQKYNLLKEAIEAVNEANNAIAKNPDLLERANNATGGYFTNGLLKDYKLDEVMIKTGEALDTYRKRIKDLLQTERKNLAPVFNELREKYSDFGNAVKNEGIEKNLVRQIELLRQFPDALMDFNYRFRDEYGNATGSARILNQFYGEYKKYLGWMRTDIDAFVEYVKNDMQNTYGDIDFTNLNAKQKEEMTKYFRDYLKLYNITNSEAIDNYWKMIHKSVPSISVPVKLDKKNAEEQLEEWKQKLYEATGKNPEILAVIKAAPDIPSAVEAITKIRKEAEEKLKALGNIPIIAKFSIQGSKIDKSKLSALDLTPWNIKAIDDWNELIDKINGTKGVEKFGLDTTPKTTGGNKTDKKLEELKNRVDLYKKFYSELENARKLYGPNALGYLKENGFGEVFGWDKITDITNYRQTIDELTQGFKANTEERKKWINNEDADKVSRKRKEDAEALKNYVTELQRMMNVMSENYQTYKKWLELSGDAELAARVAGVTQNTSYSDYLTDLMKKELNKKENAKYATLTPSDIFGLKENDIQKFGKENFIYSIWDEWQKNQQKVKKEQWDLYEEAYKGAKNYDDKIADVNRKLAKELDAINALSRSEEERSRLTQNREENASREISKIKWEKFKDENDWGEVFSDIKYVPLNKLKKLVKAMSELRVNINLNVQEMKEFQKGFNDAITGIAEKDSLNAITTAITNLTAAQNRYSALEMRGEAVRRGYDEEFKTEKEYNDALKQASKDITEARKSLMRAVKAFANDLKSLGSTFNSLSKSFGGGLGDIFGGFGAIFDGFGKGIDAISNLDLEKKGFSGLVNKISSIGSVITSMIDMNVALSNILPSTESIYEKYAEQQKKINKLRDAVDAYRVAVAKAKAEENGWIANDPLQGLREAYDIHGEILSQYVNKLYEAQEAYVESSAGITKAILPIIGAIAAIGIAWATAGSGIGASLAILGTTLTAGVATGAIATAIGAAVIAGVGSAIGQALQSAVDAITYKEGQVDARSNMKVQTQHRTFFRGEETQNLEEWIRENWGQELFEKGPEGVDMIDLKVAKEVLDSGITLVGETKETLEKLMELREQYDEWQKQIRDYISDRFSHIADDMTKAIWDWLSEGENALDKFHEYASDTFRQIAQDAVSSFLKVTVLDKFQEQLEKLYKAYSMKDPKTGGRLLDEQGLMLGVASIAGEMSDAFETALPMAENLATIIKDAFDFHGYDITNSDSSKSSSAKEIQSVTENTAGLIASYVNAVRADTSVNRVTLTQILIAVQTQVEMPVIARAQLQQLQVIAGNTGRNVEIVDSIYSLLHSIAPDGTAWKIR